MAVELADLVGEGVGGTVDVTGDRRGGQGVAFGSQPTLDALRNLALALHTSADSLLFEPDERGPQNPSLRLRLEAIDQLDPDEQNAIRTLIEGAILRHQARQLAG